MDEKAMKKMVRRCVKMPQFANLDGFLIVALDLAVIGMGAGGAFVRRKENETWSFKILEGTNRAATVKDAVELIEEEDLYSDSDREEDTLYDVDDESAETADFRLLFFAHGADVRFFAHMNRTEDGFNIKEDRVSLDRGCGPRELPIVYWNVGGTAVKADGRLIRPGCYHVLFPSDPARMERRKTEYQAKQCLLEQYNSQIRRVTQEIINLRPDCPKPLAHRLAVEFCNCSVSA